MRTLFLIGTLLFLGGAVAHGEIYKWTDTNGKRHFTDNIAAIPPAYRAQVEKRSSTSPALTADQPGQAVSPAPPTTLPSDRHHIPLHGEGNNLFVDVVLNGSVSTQLQVDTGATYTVISPKLAQQLRLNVDRADLIPIVTANGTVVVPLTRLTALAVGDATVQDMDVIVHDAGGNGLLGMSFLSHFQVALNTRDRAMILVPMQRDKDAMAHGGRSERWWRHQFAFYRSTLDNIKVYLQERSTDRAEKARLVNALQLFQQKLLDLERKATQAAVPRHWRY